ncbi:MAG: CAP domain-containing protein [Deltaproteobacteria bacterium]|nr:CAP domain-containing protein [Deltaproteobacteria bacterium]
MLRTFCFTAMAMVVAIFGAACGDGGDGGGLAKFHATITEGPLPAYCNDVQTWPADWLSFEDQVLTLTNQRRALGASCDYEGTFGPAGPLTYNRSLRCSARVQSKDLAVRAFFDHVNPDGLGPSDRIDLAEYQWSTCGENIAAGQLTPNEVVDGWMHSPGHCANIMNADYVDLGVGYYKLPNSQYVHYWTQNFGTPF